MSKMPASNFIPRHGRLAGGGGGGLAYLYLDDAVTFLHLRLLFFITTDEQETRLKFHTSPRSLGRERGGGGQSLMGGDQILIEI